MEKIEGGIWEVFVPGLQRYDAYQYAVFQADGSYVGKGQQAAAQVLEHGKLLAGEDAVTTVGLQLARC